MGQGLTHVFRCRIGSVQAKASGSCRRAPARTTEEAFSFYKSVFGTEFSSPIARFKDIPAQPGQPPLPEADKNLIMHVEMALQEMFWGGYFGSLADRHGIRWMFNCADKA